MTSQTTTRTSPWAWTAAMADPWLHTTLRFPASRCGPPGMVNGGWVSGSVAGHLGTGPVEVLLRNPTPLESPLELRAADDQAVLTDDATVLVAARRVHVSPVPPAPVTPDEARAAEARFVGHHDHPFPGCFVCGRMCGQVFSALAVDQPYAVVDEASGEDGRKLFSRSAVYDRSGSLVGVAEATWIAISLGSGT